MTIVHGRAAKAQERRRPEVTAASEFASRDQGSSCQVLSSERTSPTEGIDRRDHRRSLMQTGALSVITSHKYEVGHVVNFTPGKSNPEAMSGSFEVLRHLPYDGSENLYRVRCVADGHERVVRESQLK